MSPQHFFAIYLAETSKLFSRLTARLGLVVVAATAVITVLFMWWLDNSGIGWTTQVGDTITENTLGSRYDFGAADVLVGSLWPRNALFIGRLFLIALTALTVAAEFSARTLREDVLRPVPRFAIPLAKWMAINTWAAVALVITFVFSAGLALPIFGLGGSWLNTLLAYFATWAGDVGLVAVTVLAAFASRSVAGTIVVMFLVWLLNTVLGWAVWIASKLIPFAEPFFAGQPEAAAELAKWSERIANLQVWLPSSALELWQGYALDTPWAWQSIIVLFAVTGGALAATVALFQRQDVP